MPVCQKIRGMTEKFVLREAARPVLTDTVYRRQKHPFLSPPATLNPNDRLHEMMQDALRGSGLRRAVLRSGRRSCDCSTGCRRSSPGEQVAIDQILMMLLSASVLGERFGLAA